MEPPRPHSTNTTATILPKKRKFLSGEECGSSTVVAGSAGLESMASSQAECSSSGPEQGSAAAQAAKRNRCSYSLEFKVAVLDSYYNDTQTRLNQRKTALKYGVNRRQIQKWLAQEETLRGSVGAGYTHNHSLGQVPALPPPSVSTTIKHQPGPLTVVEEQDFVIDEDREGREYKYNYEDDNKPINLCKANNIQVEQHQVDSTRDLHQMPEVGSSVSTSPKRTHADPVSSHILDTSLGVPARGVLVTMFAMGGQQVWTKLQSRVTNEDGRASNFLSWEDFKPGTYKMHFATGQYFKEKNTETFYPFAEVVFEIKDSKSHYHVPLILSPCGYSTYRGS